MKLPLLTTLVVNTFLPHPPAMFKCCHPFFPVALNMQPKEVDSQLLLGNMSYSKRDVTVALRRFSKV